MPGYQDYYLGSQLQPNYGQNPMANLYSPLMVGGPNYGIDPNTGAPPTMDQRRRRLMRRPVMGTGGGGGGGMTRPGGAPLNMGGMSLPAYGARPSGLQQRPVRPTMPIDGGYGGPVYPREPMSYGRPPDANQMYPRY